MLTLPLGVKQNFTLTLLPFVPFACVLVMNRFLNNFFLKDNSMVMQEYLVGGKGSPHAPNLRECARARPRGRDGTLLGLYADVRSISMTSCIPNRLSSPT